MLPKIYLMGMPGSGKTTLGKKIAHKLELPFFDLDEFICKKYNCSVEELFVHRGEHAFRDIESSCLREITQSQTRFLLSLGGGTPCFNHNLEFIRENGLSLYLQLSSEALFSRLAGEQQNSRPLFKGLNEKELTEKIASLLQTREPFYRQAKLIIPGLNTKPEQICKEILSLM